MWKGHKGSGKDESLRPGEGSKRTENGKTRVFLRVGNHPGFGGS